MEITSVIQAIRLFRRSLLILEEGAPHKIELHPRAFQRLMQELYDLKIGTVYDTTPDQKRISIRFEGMIIEPGEVRQ